MKFGQIAIGTILFIEAALLLYSPQERFNFHSFLDQIKQQMPDCQCLHQIGYQTLENIRYFLVAFIVAGAYSLTLGSNLFVGIVAQLLWTLTQTELYYNQGIKEVRNTLVQVLFLVILVTELCNEWKECKKAELKKRQLKQIEEQRLRKEAEKASASKEGPQDASKKKAGQKESKKSK